MNYVTNPSCSLGQTESEVVPPITTTTITNTIHHRRLHQIAELIHRKFYSSNLSSTFKTILDSPKPFTKSIPLKLF